MANSAGKVLAGVLIGAAVGAALGVLFAPDKGSKTRKKVKSIIDDTKDEANEQLSLLSDKLSQLKEEFEAVLSAKKEQTI